jgi:folate-binding protein YgfZ
MPINFSTSPAFFPWRPACWLKVAGEDAATFLQGQFTNDLRTLPAAGAVYGLWLTVKGKVLADSFVLPGPTPTEFWVGSYFSPAEIVRERLESHVIADDVTLTDETEQWAGVCLGPDVAAALRASGELGDVLEFAGRRGRDAAVEWMYRRTGDEPAAVVALRAAGQAVEAVEMERRRIAAGIPAVPRDLGPGDLPNEGGLEGDAISYTKGCYLGQEVMARLKSMGQVRRRLWRVRGAGERLPDVPAPVFAGARQVGEVRSAVRKDGNWIGLAMVSLLHVSPGAELGFAAEGPAALRLEDAP